MLIKLLTKIFGNRNQRILNKFKHIVHIINHMESRLAVMSDENLKNNTQKFRNLLHNGKKLDDLLPEAFATVREAIKRVFGIRLFDVQILGGIILHNQCVAEMRTGEGKTLTAILPAYLNALLGKGVHIVTMNDYLANRDAKKNSPLFAFLGLSMGINLSGMSLELKKKAYNSDITYGTNNEYGFDYLRDNMVLFPDERVQRKLYYALIDEVDSILIDEARTPLIISGVTKDNSALYIKINEIIPSLIRQDTEDSDVFHGKGDFSVDEKTKQIYLTERGLVKIENILVKKGLIFDNTSLYSSNNIILMHHIISALKAHVLFIKNVDYIVKNREVIIIDEHTGRSMKGRRWSDGLHQAIEAKEKVMVNNENQTLASITFQNYFRLYEKLSGMTGTALTESYEFSSIYNLSTIVVPTNCPMIRRDLPDLIYISEEEKIAAIINDIKRCITKNQPVLVGTISIEKSEIISFKLNKLNIKHNVLNAKNHAREAEIIAQAGQPSAVTIATNMAGRGTDIVLGGNINDLLVSKYKDISEENKSNLKKLWKKRHQMVLSSGGLHVIGTERHESRRIDNQLRGRSGRQGDCGSSRFYLSMEDSLMRIFSSNRIINIMKKLGLKYGEPIEHKWVTKAIENAQKKVESRNFDIRKQLLAYDNIINKQRNIIYTQRNQLIDSNNVSQIVISFIFDTVKDIIESNILKDILLKDLWYKKRLKDLFKKDFSLYISLSNFIKTYPVCSLDNLVNFISLKIKDNYFNVEKSLGSKNMRFFERLVMIKTLDIFWQDHISNMEYLREGIHLRGYAQKDPKQEYQKESFTMFFIMLKSFKYEVISTLIKVDRDSIINFNFNDVLKDNHFFKAKDFGNNIDFEVSRNMSCMCGSGKKYKYCHGKLK